MIGKTTELIHEDILLYMALDADIRRKLKTTFRNVRGLS